MIYSLTKDKYNFASRIWPSIYCSLFRDKQVVGSSKEQIGESKVVHLQG
jgi:hypothetical protein